MTLDQVNDDPDKENFSMEQMGNALKQKSKTKANSDKKSSTHGATVKKKMTKEEQIRMLEEKKLKREVSIFLRLIYFSFFLVCIHK